MTSSSPVLACSSVRRASSVSARMVTTISGKTTPDDTGRTGRVSCGSRLGSRVGSVEVAITASLRIHGRCDYMITTGHCNQGLGRSIPMTDPLAFFREAVPVEWFTAPVDVTFDRDEILVTGCLASEVDPAEFRERSRPHRVRIADQAEARFLRKVSWAIRHND